MNRQSGMTLIEVIIVMAMLGVLAVMATFAFAPLLAGSTHKEAARNVVSAFRDARSRAITENVTYQTVFDLDSRSFWLVNAGGSIVKRYDGFANDVGMAIGADCTTVVAGDGNNAVGELMVTFNGNGTCSSLTEGAATAAGDIYVCVLDDAGDRIYHSGILSTVSGKAIVEKRNAADTDWD